MAILENTVSAAARHPAATLICGTLARLPQRLSAIAGRGGLQPVRLCWNLV